MRNANSTMNLKLLDNELYKTRIHRICKYQNILAHAYASKKRCREEETIYILSQIFSDLECKLPEEEIGFGPKNSYRSLKL